MYVVVLILYLSMQLFVKIYLYMGSLKEYQIIVQFSAARKKIHLHRKHLMFYYLLGFVWWYAQVVPYVHVVYFSLFQKLIYENVSYV